MFKNSQNVGVCSFIIHNQQLCRYWNTHISDTLMGFSLYLLQGLKPMGEGTNTSSHAPSSRHQMKLTSKSVLEFDCSPLMNGRSTLKPIDLQQSDIDRRAVEKLGNGKSALLSAYANQLVPRLNRSEGPRPCRPRALPRINGHGVEPSPGPIEDDYTNTAWWLQQKHRMLQKVYGGLRA